MTPVRPELVPPAEGTRHKRFRLSIVGADEDTPRLVRAYGRACQGEFGLVLRPLDQRGVLVLVTKKDGGFLWQSGEAASAYAGLERADAEVVRADQVRLRILDGEYKDVSFGAYEEVPAEYEHGDQVEVVFAPDDQFARLAEQVAGRRPGIDAPEVPKATVSPPDAVKAVKVEQKAVPKAGPVTLRGRWVGYLYCEGGAPRVELKRKLATYGTLWVFSTPGEGWAWAFDRTEKWFGAEGASSGKGIATLRQAIHDGVAGAMELVRDACSFKDTRRRAAHDEDWAARHPIRRREPKRNPVDRLKEPKPKKPRTRKAKRASTPKPKRAPAPRSVNTRDAAPEVPQDRKALQEMADKAQRAAQDLVAVDAVAPDWELVESPVQVGMWFDDNGWQGIGEAIIEYAEDPTYPVHEFLSDVKKDLRAAETVHDDDPDPKLYAEARDKLVTLRQALESAPLLLERARRLIRYARSMARPPLCQGAEQKAALKAIEDARKAYEATRAKIRKGHKWAPDRTLRRIGEKVALAAARASKACASGQTKLPTAAKTPTTPADKPPSKRKTTPNPKPPRKPKAPPMATSSKEPPAADAAKDQALIDAFSRAFAAVLGDEAA